MKILLTGPTGFIGSAFMRLALKNGHELAGLIVPNDRIPSSLQDANGITWVRGTLDSTPWREIVKFAPEVCLHTAWVTTPGVYLDSQENDRFRDASFQFLTRLRESGTSHIIGLGTCIEYRISGEPLSEERTPIEPKSRYARCKNELRLMLENDAKLHGIDFCWGRVFYPYGPGEHPARLCSSIIHRLSRGERVVLKTPNSRKDYIFIEDLADALLRLMEKHFSGTLNLGTGKAVSVLEIANTLELLLNKHGLVEGANPPEDDPLPLVLADPAKLHGIGWRPRISIGEGLARLVKTVLESERR